jgi:uncharacterized SAM-binding protein YcdF (DUF218 family)
MVVLGNQMKEIQKDRVLSAIEYSKSLENTYIWFLSGGVKGCVENEITEASNMRGYINEKTTNNIVLDNDATNTAENFVNLKKWLTIKYKSNEEYEIIITTSEYHKRRALKIFEGIFEKKKIKWNVSKKACSSCWSDEIFHMKNIENDVKNALQK